MLALKKEIDLNEILHETLFVIYHEFLKNDLYLLSGRYLS